MPLRRRGGGAGAAAGGRGEGGDSGLGALWQPAADERAPKVTGAVMKSEAHGRLYVIIAGSLKPDSE